MSFVSLGEEADNLVRECGLTVADLAAMSLAAARRSFMPAVVRERAEGAIEGWRVAQERAASRCAASSP